MRRWCGGTSPSFGARPHRLLVRGAWRDYCLATAYLIVLPVITLMGWDSMPERSKQFCLTLTERAVATIDEIDALGAFA